ncbi:MAG TPA: DUF1629 domain-containing protein [Povalibacter sp.]
MNSNFVIWKYKSVADACVLKDFKGLEQTYRLNNGTPLAAEFPPGVSFHMDEDFPDDLLIVDNVLNADMVIVASKRLCEAVQSHVTTGVEYLPVNIVDHKGRVASKEHCIIHPVQPVDAIDKDQSVFETNIIDPDDIESFEKLVVDESRVPDDRKLFRLQGFWGLTLVHPDVARALDQHGFAGLGWQRLEDYPET